MICRIVVAIVVCSVLGSARAQAPLLQPLAAPGSTPPSPWQVVGLPMQKKPYTRFSLVDLDGRRALRVEADHSYGNLVHPLNLARPALQLVWQWRVEQLIERANLNTKEGDDTALKVCVMFDLPLERVPFVERQVLRIARSNASDPLPAATVCYVWDTQLPVGTEIDNAFTRRMRYIVLQSGASRLRQWTAQRRDVVADFFKLFGNETTQLPPIIGVAVGADTDNTHSRSVGHVADLALEP